jgi:NAD(P)H-flavin reductase
MVTELPDPESDCIELRIQPRDGFTQRLLERSRTLALNKTKTAFIKGPYGLPYEFSEFGTVVMFASSIGIAGYLSYIKEILRHHQQLDTKTRDILLI